MQFSPEEFPVADYKFVANSSLGNLAKEVEQLQYLNLLKTLGPNSPVVPILLEGIINNSSLENRAVMIETLQQGQEAQKQQQAQVTQLQMGQAQAEIGLNQAEAQENMAQAQKAQMEAQMMPKEVQAKLMSSLANNLPSESDEAEAEFKRRKEVAELMLKQEELRIKQQDMIDNKEIVKLQMQEKRRA
jgi:hypothetical protein